MKDMQELDQGLIDCKERLSFLVEYTSFTPREVRLNAEVFKWNERIDQVFDDHDKIITEKKAQYQEGLKVLWTIFFNFLVTVTPLNHAFVCTLEFLAFCCLLFSAFSLNFLS